MILRRLAPFLVLLAVLGVVLLACDDPSYIDSVPVLDAGGAVGDGAPGDGSGGFDLAPCMACLNAPDQPGPGCYDEVHACGQDSMCSADFACAQHCLGGTSTHFIQCGLPCGTEAGLVASGPSYQLAVAFFGCVITGACASKCTTP